MAPSPILESLKYLAPIVLVPAAGATLLTRLLLPTASVFVSALLIVLLTTPLIPTYILGSKAWVRSRHRRAAAQFGAELPPWVEDGSWFGFGNVKTIINNLKNGLLGESPSFAANGPPSF